MVTNNKDFFTKWFDQEYIEDIMGDSFFDRMVKFVFSTGEEQYKECVSKCVSTLTLLVQNLFISTPIESAQDVAEYQFGFIVDTIAGEKVNEEAKSEQSMDVDKKEEEKGDEEKKDKEKEVDENESKVLEQNNNKKKSVLKDKQGIFTLEDGQNLVIKSLSNHFETFSKYLTEATDERVEGKTFGGHRRSLSVGGSLSKTLIANKYKHAPINRILIAKFLSWFNVLLKLHSSDFLDLIKAGDILKSIVKLCEIYDDHSLIQLEIRTIFITILTTDDIVLKQKLLNESRCIFLFAKKLNMVDFTNMLSRKK